MTLGQRIQELRKQAGLSQEGLGEALGVSRQAVSKWEGDNGIPELDTLIAMSKLFGVTLGQLLGVEEPKAEEDPGEAAALTEERVEAILRRYTQESRQHQNPAAQSRWWKIAVMAGGVLLGLVIVLFAQIVGMKDTISNLRWDLSDMQSDLSGVRGQLNGVSGQIREQISEALEESANLISTFDCQVVGMDVEAQTVDLLLSTTLKSYTAGSTLRFMLDWSGLDGSQNRAVTEAVEGPDFSVTATVPMTAHLEVGIRAQGADGSIQEQRVNETIYSLHPENFRLEAYNFQRLVALTITYRGQTSTISQGAYSYAEIFSAYPQLVWPEQVSAAVSVNGELLIEEELEIVVSDDSGDVFEGRLRGEQKKVKLKEGDTLEVVLTVTDNLGRTQTFVESGTVNDGELKTRPMAAPATRIE